MRRFYFALFSFVLAVAVQPLVAGTYYVGSCRVGSYGTIQAAVSLVPAGSTIDVCPGTYPEQVVISKALTLQGVFSDNAEQAVIAMPSSGLTTTSSIFYDGGIVAAQVQVTAGPVKITNITVDGTATSSNCPTVLYLGIFYSSGSSGTIDEVEARNQNCSGTSGVGIEAENGAGATESLTIEDSNVNNSSYEGALFYSSQSPATLNVTIKNNFFDGAEFALVTQGSGGTVSDNVLSGDYIGLAAVSAANKISSNTSTAAVVGIDVDAGANISDNTIIGSEYGITSGLLEYGAGGTISSNHINNSTVDAIYLVLSGATIKSNIITQAGNVGIEFNCLTTTESGNTINGAPVGLDQVPASVSGANKFYNVPTTETEGCPSVAQAHPANGIKLRPVTVDGRPIQR
jgi:hypothetical protein